MPPEAAAGARAGAEARQARRAAETDARRPKAQRMIPELGHFALILALLVALVQGVAADARRARAATRAGWRSRGRRRAAQFAARRARVRLPRVQLRHATTSRSLTSRSNSNSQLPLHYRFAGDVGLARRLAAAVAADARRLDARGRRCSARHLPTTMRRARARRDGPRSPSASCCSCCSTSNPFERLLPAAAGRPRPESAAAGPGHGHPSADALHGLRRLLGRVRVRDRGAARRPARRARGRAGRGRGRPSRGASSRIGIALGSVVGVLRARLGRLVVLGSGRERVVHAVARRHRADPFAGGHREARQRSSSWTVLLAIVAFSLSLLGTFLVRSGVLTSVHAFATDPTRGIFILVFLAHRHRRLARAVRVARAARSALGGALRAASRARSLLLANNVLLVVADGDRCCSARCIRCSLDALEPRQDLGRPALLRRRVRAADGAARVPDGRRPARALEAGASCPTLWTRLRWALARRDRDGAAAAVRVRARGSRWSRSACCSRSGSSRRRRPSLLQRLRSAPQRRPRRPLARSRRVVRHAASRTSASRCSSSA